MIKEIKKLIEENRLTYKNQPDRIIADYRGERAFTKDYNGRQILELLQNADDAGAREVLIKLNTINRELIVSNNGVPFDIDGVKSLMLANLSSRNRIEFIGNKGLGFRSILNWASEVSLSTKGVELKFSPDIAKREFDEIVQGEDVKSNMLKEKELLPGTVPFPVLAIPDCKINHESDNLVKVKIRYKEEYEQDIKDQLVKDEAKSEETGLRPEILLFLNNISKVEININGQISTLVASLKTSDFVRIGDEEWKITHSGDQIITDKKKHYRIKIARKKDLSDTFNKLFTFFPTQVAINLPCLIHATFDLDVARNYLNKTDANKYILHELVDMIKHLALKISGESLSWYPYILLTPVVRDSNKLLIRFYDELDDIKKMIPVYPCVDGKYRTLEEVKFYNTEFSEWIFKNDFSSVFPELLLAPEISTFNEWETLNDKKYNLEIWKDKINKLSREILYKQEAIKLRAEILTLLLKPEFKTHTSEPYALLINRSGDLIEEGSVVFTPILQSDEDFDTPSYLKLEFLNRELYDLLIARHKESFKQGEPESREINRLFNEIVNIQPYDSNNVFKRIISGTKEYLKKVKTNETIDTTNAIIRIIADTRNFFKKDDTKQESFIVGKMVQSVFKNYKHLKKETKKFSEPFPLINQDMIVKSADNLFLNASFPSGKLTEDLYEGILTSSNFLIDLEFFGLDIEDEKLVEEFFIWMGVNKYVKSKTDFELKIEKGEDNNFLDFVLPDKDDRPQQVTNYTYKGSKIDNFDNTVAKLSPDKIILLVLKEKEIKQKLDDSHGDQFGYNYNRVYHSINSSSYISFQLLSLNIFNNFLIYNNIPFINQPEIDSKSGLLAKYNIEDTDLKYLLLKLGAKKSFDDLNPKRIYELLNNYQSLDPEGKTAQQFYRLALNSLDKRDYVPINNLRDGLRVFAKCNGKKEWKPVTEVYYSNDTVLPETILKDKYILDVPKRFGEAKVKQFLGVQLFNNLKLNIVSKSLFEHPDNESLKEELEKLNKYILAIRIKDPEMKEDTKISAANRLKNAKLFLVERGQYTVNDGPETNLKNFEFINDGTNFYLCVDKTKNLQSLKNQPTFYDAISEIFCIVFKVWEQRSAFRSAIKVGVDDLEHQFRKDGEEELLKQARTLLGVSEEEINFWESLFKIKQIDFPKEIDEKGLLKRINTELGISIPKQYKSVDFENFDNLDSFKFLKEICLQQNIKLSEIKDGYSAFPALIKWHMKQLNNELDNIEPIFGSSLWDSLKDSTESKQKLFIPTLGKLRPWFNDVKWDELEELNSSIVVDYSEILIKYIKEKFGINIDLSKHTEPPKILYKDLLSEYNIEESQLSDNERSLLYFPNKNEQLIQILKQYREKEAIADVVDDKEQPQELKIINTSLLDILPKDHKNKMAGKGAGMHDPTTEKNKKRAGKKAELLVRNQLVKEFGRENVQWVSGNSDESSANKSDAFGYDFRYRKPSEKEWSYLEVKSVTSNSFIISYNEVCVGLKNGAKYHLGLVKDDVLHLIIDFFTDEEKIKILKQLQSKSSIRPRDYNVYFKLQEQNHEQSRLISD